MRCPLKFSNSLIWDTLECEKDGCAWWVVEGDEGRGVCAITNLYDISKLVGGLYSAYRYANEINPEGKI